jgi:hypothetical protein
MKRPVVATFLVLLVVPFLLAMGVMGKPPALEKAPEPKQKLDAVIVDMGGMTTRVSSVSYDGELYLPVYRGKALITIPFQDIARIDFGQKEKSRRQATVHFHQHQPEAFTLDEDVSFVGKVPVGTYQILVKDVASIAFLPPGEETVSNSSNGGAARSREP